MGAVNLNTIKTRVFRALGGHNKVLFNLFHFLEREANSVGLCMV